MHTYLNQLIKIRKQTLISITITEEKSSSSEISSIKGTQLCDRNQKMNLNNSL